MYTAESETRLREIAEEEDHAKTRTPGSGYKQKLTNKQIHEKPETEGFKVSRALINTELAKLRRREKEVFIRQEYEPGDRLEYDFGEVRPDCGGGVTKYHIAVFSSLGDRGRRAFLYTNEKIGVFVDSHVKMFKLLGGGFPEVVYDNMRNSTALKSVPKLKAIFDAYYNTTPKAFIELFIEHRELPIKEILSAFDEKTRSLTHPTIEALGKTQRADVTARANVSQYNTLIQKGTA